MLESNVAAENDTRVRALSAGMKEYRTKLYRPKMLPACHGARQFHSDIHILLHVNINHVAPKITPDLFFVGNK